MKPDPKIRVRRHPERASYDREAVFAVLDAGWLAHVGIVQDGKPVVIPMLYARIGDDLYLHGAVAARLLKNLNAGLPCCLTVTHVDGLVLARSQFSHSVNYRSAVVFGTAFEVSDPELKHAALVAFVDAVLPGRAAEARAPDATELAATSLVRVEIQAASVKIRSGGVKDHVDDLALPVWAGVVPMHTAYSPPLTEPDARERQIPASVQALLGGSAAGSKIEFAETLEA